MDVKLVPVATKRIVLSNTISRLDALDMMKKSKGRFFTAVFVKKDGKTRTMNCKYMEKQPESALGYIKVKDCKLCKSGSKNYIRNVNLQTLRQLSIGGKVYKVK